MELQWSDCANDLANPGLIVNTVIVSDHTYWWHVLPRLDLASSQSDKLWWVFQSKHNWSSLLTSNLYSARVHLTRHCRPHLTSPPLTSRSSQNFTVPDHFTIWGNKHRARCYHQPYQAVSPATLLWRNGSSDNWTWGSPWKVSREDVRASPGIFLSYTITPTIIHSNLVWQNCSLLVGGVGCSWSGTRGA